MIEVNAKIKGIKYTPLLCRELETFKIKDIESALKKSVTFILEIDPINSIALSWWVSPKRTRSYPYPRVYDSFKFGGKKVTIIPILKDEGIEGDRDYLQWDTVALMSLLGVYVIIGYYDKAEPSKHYKNKITKQDYNIGYITKKIKSLMSYHSDALHWNVKQLEESPVILKLALNSYKSISSRLGIKMHSSKGVEARIERLREDAAKSLSRTLAKSAQEREVKTIQPKEDVTGEKAALNITNFLGGEYHFTADEIRLKGDYVEIVEAKTGNGSLPGEGDIKDGLIKMILFTNMQDAEINGKKYKVLPVLKLTANLDGKLSDSQKIFLNKLKEEAKINGFKLDIRMRSKKPKYLEIN